MTTDGLPSNYQQIAVITEGNVVEVIGVSHSLAHAFLNNPTFIHVPPRQNVNPGCKYIDGKFHCPPEKQVFPESELVYKDVIFVAIAAFNEDDIHQTITTCLTMAKEPNKVHFGVVLHYPEKNFPDLSAYPHTTYINIDDEIGLGTGPTRDLAASMLTEEEYYLQIDAHTVFKKDWDVILKAYYKELKKKYDKPIISTYVPFWYRDKVTDEVMVMGGLGLNHNFVPWALRFKADDKGPESNYLLDGVKTPDVLVVSYDNDPYYEHHLTAGHFLFTSSKFLEEVPFDPNITYHEENTTALRAWTRGYRIFSIKEDVLWTREFHHGKDTADSWRSRSDKLGESGKSFRMMIVEGTLHCKKILTGELLGIWGAPTKELFDEYELASGSNYQQFYDEMDAEVEKDMNKYYAATELYKLEREQNV